MTKVKRKTASDNDSRDARYSEKMTAAAHDAVDRMGEKAARAEDRIRDAADDVQRRSSDARDRARSMGDEAVVGARSYVHEHPLASLAMAFGAGVVISALMRR